MPYAERNIVFGAHTASLGAGARLLGMLATTRSRWDDAQHHFEYALAFDARTGGRPWLARSRCEFAAMLMRRAHPSDQERARPLAAAALDDARELGILDKTRAANRAEAAAFAVRHGLLPPG